MDTVRDLLRVFNTLRKAVVANMQLKNQITTRIQKPHKRQRKKVRNISQDLVFLRCRSGSQSIVAPNSLRPQPTTNLMVSIVINKMEALVMCYHVSNKLGQKISCFKHNESKITHFSTFLFFLQEGGRRKRNALFIFRVPMVIQYKKTLNTSKER